MITDNGVRSSLLLWSRINKNRDKKSGRRNDKKKKTNKKTNRKKSKDKNNNNCMGQQLPEALWLHA